MRQHVFLELGREAVGRDKVKLVIPEANDGSLVRAAKLRRRFDERLKHGLQIERRTADDLEHVGGRGLLLQRFAQVVSAFTQLAKQPRVLDRDDRLGSQTASAA